MYNSTQLLLCSILTQKGQEMPLPFHENKTKTEAWTSQSIDFAPHLHACPELVYMVSGELSVQIDTLEYTMKKGDFAVIFPNVIHSYRTLTTPEETEIRFMICGKASQNIILKNYAHAELKNPIIKLDSLHEDVSYIFDALYREIRNVPDSHITDAYFQLFWMRLLPSLSITEKEREPASDLAASSLLYISEHFREPITLDSLSRELGVCRFYVSRIFSKILHVGFCEYVNTLRVNFAKELLITTDQSILEIAMLSGFQSQQTFNRAFKQISEVTPAAYRKNLSRK